MVRPCQPAGHRRPGGVAVALNITLTHTVHITVFLNGFLPVPVDLNLADLLKPSGGRAWPAPRGSSRL